MNVVAPGPIETDFSGGMVRDNPDLNRRLASMTALGRVGLPDDVGGAVAMLLAPSASSEVDDSRSWLVAFRRPPAAPCALSSRLDRSFSLWV